MPPCRVLFICTGNSARSILSEATLNHLAPGRFEAFSAGSQPTGRVSPYALETLAGAGISAGGLNSKSWDRFVGEAALPLHIVITVCDSAAREPCPVLFGDFVRSHWGLPDPAAIEGSDVDRRRAFRQTFAALENRIRIFASLPLDTLDRMSLQSRLDAIGQYSPGSAVA